VNNFVVVFELITLIYSLHDTYSVAEWQSRRCIGIESIGRNCNAESLALKLLSASKYLNNGDRIIP
jgi:hypothetical protein